jgi:hypothetical protein
MKKHLPFAFSGLLMGLAVSFAGATSYDEIHRMTTLQEGNLFLVFAGAVALLALGYRLLGRGEVLLPRPVHPGSIWGGVVFGLGWSLTGACPTMATVQLGEGYLPAAVSLLGMCVGMWVYGKFHARFLRWEAASCDM